ncbi:XdhC family protein [Echinicola shivajiensis]|uniref:XdhC family protein n=1 Tax=Echinicola shivajiensis TaxID=1035916 RepID=UPI001BFC5988|nr:XdhC/CoxI family protein [Echinicola shivajiensis]
MKEIISIIDAYETAQKKGEATALATVVKVEGSSYRGAGARMLITEKGQLSGAISGGCLEGDALRRALMVIIQNKPLLVKYDTSEENGDVFGVGLGCEGIIYVLIEPIDNKQILNPVYFLKQCLKKRSPNILVSLFSKSNKKSSKQGTYTLIRMGQALGINNEINWADFETEISEIFSTKTSLFKSFKLENEAFEIFFEYIAPRTRLVIAGAGNDVIPLVEAGEILGWEMVLLDGRPSHANKQRFPTCQLLIGQAGKVLKEVNLDEYTALLLMTHNYNYDKEIVKWALDKEIKYIGMLGPKKKWAMMKEEIIAEGFDLLQIEMHSPMGLDIGAESSEEIALSVLAEIKAVFADSKGGSLFKQEGRIHPDRFYHYK